jgi:hypothetical protein
MRRIHWWSCVLVLAASCGGDPATDPDAPAIAAFTSSVSTLYESGMVTFSATVTDPQGPSDIVGGTLTDGGTVSYGMFAQASPGTYSLAIDWATFQDVQPINGDVDGESREVTAKFVDLAGHAGTATLTVTLACRSSGAKEAPCDGVCTPVETDPFNCGGRNLECPGASPDPLSPYSYCRAALCQEVHLMFPDRTSCEAACAARGGKCDHDNLMCPGAVCDLEEQSYATYSGGIRVPLSGCAAVPAPTANGGNFEQLGCNCKDLPGTAKP